MKYEATITAEDGIEGYRVLQVSYLKWSARRRLLGSGFLTFGDGFEVRTCGRLAPLVHMHR